MTSRTEIKLGRFQLLTKLAAGGMAEVWLAQEQGFVDRYVVVKRILPHLADIPEFIQMFHNEARIAARFSHPNIAQIHEVGVHEGVHYIAMEFVHGEDLGRVMRKAWGNEQWIARALGMRIVSEACLGLHYAHTKRDEEGRPLSVVHRDISPHNILIGFDGTVKLVDFGIAKAADQTSVTKSGAIKGKFSYMSPEQAAGKRLDARSDLFSMGLVLYELLTGVRPLKRETDLATLQAALQCDIPPPSEVAEVPSDLDPLVMGALAQNPDARYADAHELHVALEQYAQLQQWRVGPSQVSELMQALFAERLEEEKESGRPVPYPLEPLPSNPDAAVVSEPGPVQRSTNGVLRQTREARPRAVSSDSHVSFHGTSATGGGTSLGLVRQRSGTAMRMPEAPPPLLRETRAEVELPLQSPAPLREPTARPPSTAGAQRRRPSNEATRRRLSRLGAVLVLAGLGVAAVKSGGIDVVRAWGTRVLTGDRVLLTVEASQPVDVRIEHARAEGEPAEVSELGPAPIREARVARPGDTLVLYNPGRGIHHTQVIPQMPAGEPFVLRKEFKLLDVRLRFNPHPTADRPLTIRSRGRVIGMVPGPAIGLFEGFHTVEVSGAGLKKPRMFNLQVEPNASNVFELELAERSARIKTLKTPSQR